MHAVEQVGPQCHGHTQGQQDKGHGAAPAQLAAREGSRPGGGGGRGRGRREGEEGKGGEGVGRGRGQRGEGVGRGRGQRGVMGMLEGYMVQYDSATEHAVLNSVRTARG